MIYKPHLHTIIQAEDSVQHICPGRDPCGISFIAASLFAETTESCPLSKAMPLVLPLPLLAHVSEIAEENITGTGVTNPTKSQDIWRLLLVTFAQGPLPVTQGN